MKLVPETFTDWEREYLERNKRSRRVPFLVIVAVVLVGAALATKAVIDISRYENFQDADAYRHGQDASMGLE
jgi:hypothetical protein